MIRWRQEWIMKLGYLKEKIVYALENFHLLYSYKKYSNFVIKDIIIRGERKDAFLKEIRYQYIKRTIPHYYKEVNDKELENCIAFAVENDPVMFCYEDANKIFVTENDVYFDSGSGLYYAYWNGKRMYFKRSFQDKKIISDYLNNSYYEQSDKSPHKYLSDDFDIDGGIVLDIGAAEGNFALAIIDKVSHVYIFECNEEWIEALQHTFCNYHDKVTIIPKYISAKNDNYSITLDLFAIEYCVDQIDMIKMDIEGEEIDALKGAKRLIKEKRVSKWAICVYHNVNDANKVSKRLRGYTKTYAQGYIMSAVWRIHKLKYPYWVKGVIRATLL